MKKKYRLIFFLIGILGIGLMLYQTDLRSIDWSIILTPYTSMFLFGTCLLWVAIYAIHSINYKIILGKEGKKVPFLSMFKICLTGFALNNVTPAGLVGGEPYRIMALNKYCHKDKAASSTLTFSLLYVMGHIGLWFISSIVYFIVGYEGGTLVSILIGISLGIGLIILIWFIFSKDHGIVMPFMKFMTHVPFLKKIFKKLLRKNRIEYLQIDKNIKEYKKDTGKFLASFGLQILTRLLEALEYYFIISFVEGYYITYFDGLMVMSVASLIGNLVAFIPMQAGTREGGMALALDFIGVISGSSTVLIGILYRVRELLFILIGIGIIWIDKSVQKRQVKIFDKSMSKPILNFNLFHKDREKEVKNIEFTSRALIRLDGKLLLSSYRDNDGVFYTTPGGHKEIGETDEECLIREVKEETGYNINIKRKLCSITEYFSDTKAISTYYECTIDSLGESNLTDVEKDFDMKPEWLLIPRAFMEFARYNKVDKPERKGMYNREFIAIKNLLKIIK